jgi:phage-related protein
MSDELNNFLTSQSKLNTLVKDQGKSINILNMKYKVLNKVLGPFYRLFVDVSSKIETTKDVFEEFTGATEKVGEATEKTLGPLGKLLGFFTKINTIMIFVLGAFALLGIGILLLSKHLGGGESALGAFNMVMEAGKGLVDAFIGVIGTIAGVIAGLDFSAFGGDFMPVLETVFAVLGGILTLYITFITTVLEGIGQIVERMGKEGMLQRVVDAFATFFGLIGMALGIILGAFKETGLTMDDLISGIENTVQYFVDFLFSSGILDFAVQVIEYVGVIYGVIAVVAASIIALFIKIWAKLGPHIIKFVKAFFDFLNPIIRIITGILGVVMRLIMGLIGWLMPYFQMAMDGIMVILDPVITVIEAILDGASAVLDIGGSILGGAASMMGFSDGGVASGPKSGYPVALHGTEAVVPLPDGRTIPVSIKGGAGGGSSNTNNITINVSGGGNAKEIAKAVSDEVTKVMRNRSRGGSFTRGVI